MYSFVYKNFINSSGEKFSQKIKFLIYSALKKILLKFKDPEINYTLWGSPVKIPFSYNLPLIINQHPNYNLNLKRISGYLHTKYEDLKIIDVGGNIGDTVILLKSLDDFPILSIEGDAKFFSMLKENSKKFSNVVSKNVFLGEANIILKAALNANLGTGNIVSSENAKLELFSLDTILEKNENFINSKLLKIDTDGFDYKIIRGAENYINKSKPAIFIEYDPHFLQKQNENSYFIFDFLEAKGYSKIIFYDNFGDFLITLQINEKEKIEELTNYFSNRDSLKYCDLCFFHSEDEDVFEHTREEELKYFLANRKN